MRNVKIYVALLLLSFGCSVFAAPTNYYFDGAMVGITTASAWFKDAAGTQPFGSAPNITEAVGSVDTNIYRVDNATALAKNGMIAISANTWVNSVVNDVTGTASSNWQFYTTVSDLTFTIGNVLQNSLNTTSIRKRNMDATYNIALTREVKVSKGLLNLGTNTKGEYLSVLNLGKNGDGVAIDIRGADGSGDTGLTKLNIYAETVNAEVGSKINVAHGVLGFERGTAGDAGSLGNQNLDITNATITLGDDAYLSYGNFIAQKGYAHFGEIVINSKINHPTAVNAYRSRINFVTSATQGATATDKPITIDTLTLGLADDADDRTRVDISTNANVYIGTLQSKNVGMNGGMYQGVNFVGTATAGYYIGTANLAVERLTINSKFEVSGNFTNFYKVDSLKCTNVFISSSSTSFTVLGKFINNGAIYFDSNNAVKDVKVTFGSLSGGSSDSRDRITTNYGSTNHYGSVTTITLNAATGTDTYLGRLHDMGQAANPTEAITNNWAKLGVVKEGDSIQKLRGDNYYRGDTVIKAGTLLLRADSSGRASYPDWGVAAIKLQGGKFGAIGLAVETGKILGTSFEWSNGTLLVDINGANFDKIVLSGALTKIAGGTYTLDFNMMNVDTAQNYDIIGFASTDFSSADDFTVILSDANYKADLKLNANNLSVSFTLIPEPGFYASIFGAFALMFVVLRRRKK